MIIKYSELSSRLKVLNSLQKYKLPRKMCTAIARNIVALRSECELKEKQVQEIAQKYATKNEDGEYEITEIGTYVFDPEQLPLANKELAELNDFEVDLNLVTVSEDELLKCDFPEYDILTPEQEISIMWMINYKE